MQHEPRVLVRHLRDNWQGRVDPTRGEFIEAWPPGAKAPRHEYAGTADAVLENLATIERTGCQEILVLAGDHVYEMDYRAMSDAHRALAADVTVGAVEVPVEEAHHFGVLSTDSEGWIRRFVEKPRHVTDANGGSVVVSMGIYLFDIEFLERTRRRFERLGLAHHDFGRDLLPALVQEAKVAAFQFRSPSGSPGYWRDVGTPAAYWRAHLELLGEQPDLRLDDAGWLAGGRRTQVPRLTSLFAGPEAFRAGRDRSLVAQHVVVRGLVRRSVLFEDASVDADALVEDSVVLPGARIGAACHLRGVIVDSDCSVPAGVVVVGPAAADEGAQPIVLTAADFAAQAVWMPRKYAFGGPSGSRLSIP